MRSVRPRGRGRPASVCVSPEGVSGGATNSDGGETPLRLTPCPSKKVDVPSRVRPGWTPHPTMCARAKYGAFPADGLRFGLVRDPREASTHCTAQSVAAQTRGWRGSWRAAVHGPLVCRRGEGHLFPLTPRELPGLVRAGQRRSPSPAFGQGTGSSGRRRWIGSTAAIDPVRVDVTFPHLARLCCCRRARSVRRCSAGRRNSGSSRPAPRRRRPVTCRRRRKARRQTLRRERHVHRSQRCQ
jgi:hypothetical protein